jgi:hypothetical protein
MAMRPKGEKDRFLDRKGNVDRLLWGATALGLGLLLVDFFFHRHVYHPWERLWGFYGIFGAAGIVLLVQLAKVLRRLVGRSEDYYESE